MEKNNLWNMAYNNESIRVKMSVDEKKVLMTFANKSHQSISRFVLDAIAEKIEKLNHKTIY